MAKRDRIHIERVKLGRQRIWGHADAYPLEIDERLKGKKELEIIIHESLHYLLPDFDEPKIERMGVRLCETLWHEGFRKVDNSNDIPLQNNTK